MFRTNFERDNLEIERNKNGNVPRSTRKQNRMLNQTTTAQRKPHPKKSIVIISDEMHKR